MWCKINNLMQGFFFKVNIYIYLKKSYAIINKKYEYSNEVKNSSVLCLYLGSK